MAGTADDGTDDGTDDGSDDGTDEPFGHEPAADDTEVDPLLPPVLAAPPADAPTMERIPHRYRRSMGSAALAAGMIGLRDILEDPKDSRPVVEQFADEDDRERPIEVDLDPDDPSASTVTVRRPPAD
jgi:hypothetical protein